MPERIVSVRYNLIMTRYGYPGIYDAVTRQVSPFIDEAAAQEALLSILDGTQSRVFWSWREAFASEVTS
jgi:hypothetical protein